MGEDNHELWLPSAVGRMSLFLFFFSLLVLSLFLLGNFQNFLDSTQTMLLSIFETTSLLYIVAVLFNVVVRIVLAAQGRGKWRGLSAVLSLLGAAVFTAMYLFFGFLFAWLKPLN